MEIPWKHINYAIDNIVFREKRFETIQNVWTMWKPVKNGK